MNESPPERGSKFPGFWLAFIWAAANSLAKGLYFLYAPAQSLVPPEYILSFAKIAGNSLLVVSIFFAVMSPALSVGVWKATAALRKTKSNSIKALSIALRCLSVVIVAAVMVEVVAKRFLPDSMPLVVVDLAIRNGAWLLFTGIAMTTAAVFYRRNGQGLQATLTGVFAVVVFGVMFFMNAFPYFWSSTVYGTPNSMTYIVLPLTHLTARVLFVTTFAVLILPLRIERPNGRGGETPASIIGT